MRIVFIIDIDRIHHFFVAKAHLALSNGTPFFMLCSMFLRNVKLPNEAMTPRTEGVR
jgi:hypothetical protein